MRIGLRFGVGPLRIYIPLVHVPTRRHPHWTHGTCTIQHRSEGAANRCHGHT